MPRDVVSWGFFIFRKEDRMSESEFYKSISQITGESNGRLRQMGFQHVQVFSMQEIPSQYAWKQAGRRDPPQSGKAGEK